MLWALVLTAAVSDAPRHARLLTRDELARAPVEELSVQQLLLEHERTERPPTMVPWAVMGLAGPGLAGLGALGVYGGLSLQRPPEVLGQLGLALLVMYGAVFLAVGAAATLVASVAVPVSAVRRSDALERNAEVNRRIEELWYERDMPPREVPTAAVAEAQTLEDEKPGFVAPVLMLIAGTGAIAGGAALWLAVREHRDPSVGALGVALALACVGVLVDWGGIYLAIRKTQQRDELDRRIAYLPFASAAGAVDDYWHF